MLKADRVLDLVIPRELWTRATRCDVLRTGRSMVLIVKQDIQSSFDKLTDRCCQWNDESIEWFFYETNRQSFAYLLMRRGFHWSKNGSGALLLPLGSSVAFCAATSGDKRYAFVTSHTFVLWLVADIMIITYIHVHSQRSQIEIICCLCTDATATEHIFLLGIGWNANASTVRVPV